jgi:hypothetical protein
MENTNANQQGVDLLKFKKMFENLKQKDGANKKLSREQVLAKYFVPKNDKEVFRVLPPLEGRDYIETAFFHVVATKVANGRKFRKIYCPAHNDAKVPKVDANGVIIRDQQGNPVMVTKHCPLCEKAKTLLAKQDPSLKGIKKEDMTPQQLAVKESNDKIYKAATDWEAKKFYIVRGIDKGAEKDGVKFWRFKHNFKQQGVLDKLGPAVTNFMEMAHVDFTDAVKGTDLKLTVVDAEIPGNKRKYRDVSSIFPLGSSELHKDPLVIKEWLADKTTWRDIFKAPEAPNVTPEEFLVMVANDQTPYWDDTDQKNKKWVFPGHPELEEKANTRSANLDATTTERNVEMASDVVKTSYSNVTISNVTKEDVGTFKDSAVDLVAENTEVPDSSSESEETYSGDYDDLPF